MTIPEAVHLIGIGGTGLSAIARVLLERGCRVSGSDRLLSPLAERLQADGVRILIGHQPGNVLGADLVVRSSATKLTRRTWNTCVGGGRPALIVVPPRRVIR